MARRKAFRPISPALLVSRAAQPDQEVTSTTLADLGHAATLQSPSLLMAGWAVREADLMGRRDSETTATACELYSLELLQGVLHLDCEYVDSFLSQPTRIGYTQSPVLHCRWVGGSPLDRAGNINPITDGDRPARCLDRRVAGIRLIAVRTIPQCRVTTPLIAVRGIVMGSLNNKQGRSAVGTDPESVIRGLLYNRRIID